MSQDRIKVSFAPPAPRQLGLFASEGMAWTFAATCFAVSDGLTVDQWTVDRRFLAGGVWYRADWRDDLGQWVFTELAPDVCPGALEMISEGCPNAD